MSGHLRKHAFRLGLPYKTCGSCVVPGGSYIGAVSEIPCFVGARCSGTIWFLCGSTWFHWQSNAGNCYSVGGFPTNHVVPRDSTQRLHFWASLTNMGAPRNTKNISKLGKCLARRFPILLIIILHMIGVYFHILSPHNKSSRGNWKPTGQLVSSSS